MLSSHALLSTAHSLSAKNNRRAETDKQDGQPPIQNPVPEKPYLPTREKELLTKPCVACPCAMPSVFQCANRSCRHIGLQPPTTDGRAETRSPGLLVLSSLDGQKALEPLCQRRSGRRVRKWPHQRPRKKNNKRRKGARKTASLWPTEPRNPKKQPHSGGTRPQKKTGPTTKMQNKLSWPRQTTAKI